MVLKIKDNSSGIEKAGTVLNFTAKECGEERVCSADIDDILLWNTWDHGQPWLYSAEVQIERDGRKVCGKETRLRSGRRRWNGQKKLHVSSERQEFLCARDSYFPDCYISAMTKERYFRDLLNIKAAGFNLVRVHVHVEQDIFYDLCDEMGIAVIQDSEYNWTHPSTDAWAEKFIGIYKENVKMLLRHPSIICWIGMNEPGCVDPDGDTRRRFMEENPGPGCTVSCRRWTARPIIKGSFCNDDIYSGDSHNYLGS